MRSATGICAFVGMTIGGFIPSLWGDSGLFSLASLVFSTAGGLAGVWAGARLADN